MRSQDRTNMKIIDIDIWDSARRFYIEVLKDLKYLQIL